MNIYFLIAGIITFVLALLHTILGEKLILIPQEKHGVPKLFGSELAFKRVTRFAWHLTTVIMWGTAAIMIYMAWCEFTISGVANVLAVTYLISMLLSLIFTRGRHFSWYVFLAIAILIWVGATTYTF